MGTKVGSTDRGDHPVTFSFDSNLPIDNSAKPRLVLVVDLWHPDLSHDETVLLNGLHRYATATGTQLVRYWNRNRAKAGAQGTPA